MSPSASPLRARFAVLPADGDADGAEYSADQYRTALVAAGVAFDEAPAPPLAFVHGLPARLPPDAAAAALVLLEPRLAGAVAPDAAAGAVLRRARLVVTTRGETARSLAGGLASERILQLAPFCDLARPVAARRGREALRAVLATRLGLPAASPWLVTAGAADAAAGASFDFLCRALARLVMLDWQLLVTGAARAGGAVEAALLRLPRRRVKVVPEEFLAEPDKVLAAGDLFVWPALGGFGRHHLLRAHAVGLAAVSCAEPGVTEIVQDALTGRVAPAGNAESFANCVGFLLRQPVFRRAFGVKALETVIERHDALIAARRLRAALAAAGLP